MLPAFDAPRRMPAEIDLTLLWSSVVLLMIGMVMVYSASIAIADAVTGRVGKPRTRYSSRTYTRWMP